MYKITAPIQAAALLAAPALLSAQVYFGSFDEAENIDVEGIVLSGNYGATDGVALGTGEALYAIHWTADFRETIVRLDDHEGNGAVLKTDTQIVADLGAPYGPSVTLAGGLATDLTAGKLYFMDTFSGEYALLSMDLTTNTVSEVLRGAELDDTSDFAVLPTGEIVLARGDGGVGYVDPNAVTPAWVPSVSMSDFQSLLATTDDAPAETLAINPANGDVYAFCHDVLALVKIENILSTPVLTHLSEIVDADLHDMVVDENGVVYGFNEAHDHTRGVVEEDEGPAIVILDGSNVYEIHTEDIAEAAAHHTHTKQEAHEHDFEVTLWRGMAVRAELDEVELFLASSVDEFGIVRVAFSEATAVPSWELYQ